jgi:hypothetical protein
MGVEAPEGGHKIGALYETGEPHTTLNHTGGRGDSDITQGYHSRTWEHGHNTGAPHRGTGGRGSRRMQNTGHMGTEALNAGTTYRAHCETENQRGALLKKGQTDRTEMWHMETGREEKERGASHMAHEDTTPGHHI